MSGNETGNPTTDTTTASDGVGRRWLEGVSFDALFVAASTALMVGLAWDFRIHAGGVDFSEEPFFTASHTIVYGAGVGIALLLGASIATDRRRGAGFLEAIPTGYALGVLGLFLFAASGVADFAWHTVISHEDTSLESLVSPSHLGLAVGGVLFLSSPLRAAWRRPGRPEGLAFAPAAISASYVLSIVAIFATYLNPIAATQTMNDTEVGRITGMGAFAAYSLLLLGFAIAVNRRFTPPPFGTFTPAFAIPGLVAAGTNGYFEFLLPGLVAGLVADGFSQRSPPTPRSPASLRIFGAVVPIAFVGTYFLVLEQWHGIAWETTLWTGAITVAGIAGLLFTYAILPDGARVDQ